MECTTYCIRIENYLSGNISRITYGIAAIYREDDFLLVIDAVSDVSSDLQSVQKLVKLCNSLKLSPIQLRDVLDDFLNT